MKKQNRVSQEDLSATIAAAVEVETKRIEQLNAQSIDQISGGYTGTPTQPPAGTVGYFPPDPNPNNNV